MSRGLSWNFSQEEPSTRAASHIPPMTTETGNPQLNLPFGKASQKVKRKHDVGEYDECYDDGYPEGPDQQLEDYDWLDGDTLTDQYSTYGDMQPLDCTSYQEHVDSEICFVSNKRAQRHEDSLSSFPLLPSFLLHTSQLPHPSKLRKQTKHCKPVEGTSRRSKQRERFDITDHIRQLRNKQVQRKPPPTTPSDVEVNGLPDESVLEHISLSADQEASQSQQIVSHSVHQDFETPVSSSKLKGVHHVTGAYSATAYRTKINSAKKYKTDSITATPHGRREIYNDLYDTRAVMRPLAPAKSLEEIWNGSSYKLTESRLPEE